MLGSAAPKQDDNKSPPAESSKPSSSPSTPKPQPSEPEQSKPSTSSTPNPFSQLGVKSNGSSADQASSAKGTSGTLPRHPRKRPATDVDDGAAPPTQRKANPQTPESDEDYVNRVITQIFRVTANPHAMTNSAGHKLKLLPDLNEEMNAEGRSLKLTIEDLDQAIMEAGRNCWPKNKPLIEYMLPCWKRAVKAVSSSKVTEGPRREVLEEAKRLSLSYCLFGFTLPDLFEYVDYLEWIGVDADGLQTGSGFGRFASPIHNARRIR